MTNVFDNKLMRINKEVNGSQVTVIQAGQAHVSLSFHRNKIINSESHINPSHY